jgi:hypothetical protein
VIDVQHEVIHKKLSPDGQAEVARLTSLGMLPQAVARQLSSTEGRFVTNRTIYNTKSVQRAKKRAGDTTIKYLLRCLKTSNWEYEDVYDNNGKLQSLWFAHPGFFLLACRLNHVVNVDCTYKTNLNTLLPQ